MEIGIILHDDGFHVLEMPSVLDVVVAWDYDAEGKFIVLAYLILFLVVLALFLGEFRGVSEVLVFLLEPSHGSVGLGTGNTGNWPHLLRALCGFMSQRMSLRCGRLQLSKGLLWLLNRFRSLLLRLLLFLRS